MDGMGLESVIVPLLREAVDRVQPEWRKKEAALRQRLTAETAKAVADHHNYVSQWCQEAHSTLLPGVEPDAPTIELAFRSIPRRLGMGGKTLDELDLLVSERHVALLGDPGAGKTTTLRRLAKAVAHGPETSPQDDWRFVVVVVCRNENWETDKLYDVLGKKIGITGKLATDLDNPERWIREVLDVGALIVVDGLDEVAPKHRTDLERSLPQLGRHLTRSKLVVSCRSGDYVAHLDGFDIAEIRPLEATQIRAVVDAYLGNEGELFFETISAPGHPAADLTDRPLFLMQMVSLFKRRGTIPDRPIDLYGAVTHLVLQDWDEQRGVRRVSRYGAFGVEDKRRFLADLALELIRHSRIRFDEADLVEVYGALAERYSLPKAEARMVARELESHTGLIVQSGELFEFSHLSLQEYLAADAMSRGGRRSQRNWWHSYPAVAAVATALSSESNDWFGELIEQMPKHLGDTRSLHTFLHRLGQERPRFIRSAQLGRELLEVLFRARISDPEAVARLGGLKPVRDSIADALLDFDSIKVNAPQTRLARYQGSSPFPAEALAVATPVLECLVGEERLRQAVLEVGRR